MFTIKPETYIKKVNRVIFKNLFILRDVQTHTSACRVFCLHLPCMTCSCAFAHSYRLSCCDMDQSGTLWTEPPWTCQMLHGRNRPTFPTAPLKGRGYGQVRTPTMLCLRAGKSRPALKSTLNGGSYTSTQVRCPKTPSKETSHAAYKRTVSSISQSHLISWSVLRRVGSFSIHTDFCQGERNLN